VPRLSDTVMLSAVSLRTVDVKQSFGVLREGCANLCLLLRPRYLASFDPTYLELALIEVAAPPDAQLSILSCSSAYFPFQNVSG
jgi:hypothetical protein